MPLPIRDGNQSLTTLSTILVSNAHIPAHTVISFGTQAITDIATAVSGVELGPNTLNALENITVTLGQVTITGGLTDAQLRASAVTIGGSVTATISGTPSVTFSQASVTFGTAVVTGSTSILNFPATQTVTFSQAPVTFGLITGTVTANPTGTQTIAGTVSASNLEAVLDQYEVNAQEKTFAVVASLNVQGYVSDSAKSHITNSVTIGSLPAISGTVTIGAGTAQIGSVTASISGTVPISISSVTVGNSVTIGSLPPISGTVTANLGISATSEYQDFVELIDDGTAQAAIGVHIKGQSSSSILGISSSPLVISGTVTASNVINGYDIYNAVTGNLVVGAGFNGAVRIVGLNPSDGSPANLEEGGGVPICSAQNIALPISGTVTIGSLPAISGTVTANLSISSTAITSGSFTSLSSATLVPANTARKMATVYNLGAGQLFINAGATATTLGGGFMVALSSGDFYECPYTTTTLSAIFATAGTASWVSH